MTTTHLVYANRDAVIAGLAAHGYSAKGMDGEPILPTTLFTPARADIIVEGGGSGIVSVPDPSGVMVDGPFGTKLPAMKALPGFRLSVTGEGLPDFGDAVSPEGGGDVLAPPPVEAVVPDQVPMWAAQAALKAAGHYDAINTAIVCNPAADPPVPSMESTNPPVFFAWTMGNFASRQSAFIGALGGQFGLAPADIDAVFVAAERIARVAG